MNARGIKVNINAKGGHCIRIYVRKTKTTPKVLYKDGLVQVLNGRSASARRLLSGGKKGRGKRKGRQKIQIWKVPGITAPTTNLFHLKNNDVITVNVKTWFWSIII